MKRYLTILLLAWVWLASPIFAQELEVAAQLRQGVGLCYVLAYEYGNFQACLRIRPLLSWAHQRAHALGPGNPFDLEVHGLVLSVAMGNYAQSIGAAQALLKRPELGDDPYDNLMLHYCLVQCGLMAGFPELVEAHLPVALQWAGRAKRPELQFSLACLGVERELEQHPDLTLETLIARHQACWKYLDGFKPDVQMAGGVEVSRGIRFWQRELSRAERGVKGQKDRVDALLQADRDRLGQLAQWGLEPEAGYNPQYSMGFYDLVLDIAQIGRELGRFSVSRKALTLLEADMPSAKAKIALRQVALDKGIKDGMAVIGSALPDKPDLSILNFSLFEGNVSRIEGRLYQEWIRLLLAETTSYDPATRQELRRRLALARQAQAVAARGRGFMGMEEVRWDALAILFRLKEEGWQKEAAPLVRESLELSRKLGFRAGEIEALTYQGDLQRAQGDGPGALHSFQEAIELAEKQAGESKAGTRQRYNHVYDSVTELQLESGKIQDAFVTQGRLQQLNLVEKTQGSNEALTLRGRTGALEQELVSRKAAGQDTAPIEELLARTRGEFYTALTKIRDTNPKYESLLAVRPVNFAQLQKKIPPDSCLVQYFPSDTSLYIFLATATDLKIHKVQVSSAQLRDLVVQFRRAVQQAKEGSKEPLFKLHRLLIDPIEAEIADKQVLAFIPTGILDYLPMGALARPKAAGLEYLIQRKQIATILKSSDLDSLSGPPSRPTGGVLALGNPDGTLPGASQEAREVTRLFGGSQVYLGPEATVERVKGGLAYLHLATHGVLDENDPNSSYLLLAGSTPRLTLQRIFDLHLDGVRLVTLSACQTAIGREETTQGSELATLASAFSVAGSNSVVASLWSVEDQSTFMLMSEFYTALKGGSSLAAALQRAQLKVLAEPKYANPFFWAPFELIGDWR